MQFDRQGYPRITEDVVCFGLDKERKSMDEGTAANESIPDLKDLEVKIGWKTPEGLLKCMREEASTHRDVKLNSLETKDRDITGRKSLDEKIRKLKVDMVRS